MTIFHEALGLGKHQHVKEYSTASDESSAANDVTANKNWRTAFAKFNTLDSSWHILLTRITI
jgi:hypothetical protein